MELLLWFTACNDGSGTGDLADDAYSEVQSTANHWLHTISVSILIIFALHLLLHMGSRGAEFFQHPGQVVDVFVITVALIIETSGIAGRQGDLVTLLLLSRVVRVIHAIQVSVHLQVSRFKRVPAQILPQQRSNCYCLCCLLNVLVVTCG